MRARGWTSCENGLDAIYGNFDRSGVALSAIQARDQVIVACQGSWGDRRSRPKIVVILVFRDEAEPVVSGNSSGIQRGARVEGKARGYFSVRLLRA
jgi:hypothetical protein